MLRQLLLSLIHIFRLVFSDLSTIVREYEGSVDWIESLKARDYHTYYLSNYGERIRREASKAVSYTHLVHLSARSLVTRLMS